MGPSDVGERFEKDWVFMDAIRHFEIVHPFPLYIIQLYMVTPKRNAHMLLKKLSTRHLASRSKYVRSPANHMYAVRKKGKLIMLR